MRDSPSKTYDVCHGSSQLELTGELCPALLMDASRSRRNSDQFEAEVELDTLVDWIVPAE